MVVPMMPGKAALKLATAIVVVAAAAWLLRACYGLVNNTEDQPAADRIVAAIDAYQHAKGRYPPSLDALVPEYLSALPAPRRFGRIGYAPLDAGRGCLVGYYTHRDWLNEYDCRAKAWESAEYEDSRLVKAPGSQWLRGPAD
jgi:hypothetical protein